MSIEKDMEREEDILQRQLDDGSISIQEYRKFMQELWRDARESKISEWENKL